MPPSGMIASCICYVSFVKSPECFAPKHSIVTGSTTSGRNDALPNALPNGTS